MFQPVIFVAAVSAALSMVSLMEYTGISDFFSLTWSAGLVVFLLLLALSLFLYRPVCRGICPFGVLFSIPAHVSLYRIRRTERCINGKKCETRMPGTWCRLGCINTGLLFSVPAALMPAQSRVHWYMGSISDRTKKVTGFPSHRTYTRRDVVL